MTDLALPWILLGSALRSDLPAVGVCGLALVLFLIAGAGFRWRGQPLRAAFGALGLAGTWGVVLAVEPLLLLTALAAAAYGILGWLLVGRRSAPPPGRLAAAAALLVLGDLALFELALIKAAKYDAGGPVLLAIVDPAGRVDPFAAWLVALGIASRGAPLALVGRGTAWLPAAALGLCALPLAASRALGPAGALAVPPLLLAGAVLPLCLAPPLAAGGQLVTRLRRPLPVLASAVGPGAGSVLRALEHRLGGWVPSLTALLLLLLLLAALARRGGAG